MVGITAAAAVGESLPYLYYDDWTTTTIASMTTVAIAAVAKPLPYLSMVVVDTTAVIS